MQGMGDQLFAGTGFTQDQHCAVVGRHVLNQFLHGPHGLRVADTF